jgi:hypothetical protein
MEIWRLLAVSWKAEKLLTYRILYCLLDHPKDNYISFDLKELFYSTHSGSCRLFNLLALSRMQYLVIPQRPLKCAGADLAEGQIRRRRE